jgi:thioredoxin-related protein
MKKLAALLLAWCCVGPTFAAEANWLTDFTAAKARAKAEGKLLLMDFTGSDWCPPCMAIKKNVFNTEEFAKFAKDNLVLVEVDFPRRKKLPGDLAAANEKLSDQFNIEAFPTIIVLNAEGKEIRRTQGYQGESPNDYIASLKKLKAK